MNTYTTLYNETHDTPLDELETLTFTLQELEVYLGRNPEDEMAASQHQQFIRKRDMLLDRLRRTYGSLVFFHGGNRTRSAALA